GSEKAQRLTCERAIYYRDSLLLQARGNVRAIDDENDVELRAGSVDFDRARHLALATMNPEMRSRDDKGREAVLRATKLRLDTETRVAEAIDSVRVESDTLRVSGDYGVFDD